MTSTTYGTWLPGDSRGFVSTVEEGAGPRVRHNIPGTPVDSDTPEPYRAAKEQMRGPPIYFTLEQATALLSQFQETAQYRGWQLLAVAIMTNHFHIVVGVPGDPDPADLLGDFKSYGSRTLNRRWGKPISETWWTESGSRRKMSDLDAVARTSDYVINRQPNPLLVWLSPEAEELLRRLGNSLALAP